RAFARRFAPEIDYKEVAAKIVALAFGIFAASTLCAAAGPTLIQPTFTHDVAPIVYQHCVKCHHADDIAPMPLITYRDVRPWAAAIREQVVLKKMPPWKADPHTGKWSNDASLSPEQIEIIKAWVDKGCIEGDPKDLPPAPVFTDGWRAGKPDAIIAIPKFELSAKGADEYSYITVPTNFTEDRWVVSAELRPGNRRIVHHAHVFVLDPEPAEKAAPDPAKKTPPDPAKEYAKWLTVKQGSLSWIRPDAPAIDDGCIRDDNGLLPGSTQGDL